MLPPGYFRYQAAGSQASAAVILPLVQKLLPVKSVVDVGCGTGTWLAEAAKLGISDYLGIDGDYVDRTQLAIPEDKFIICDLAHVGAGIFPPDAKKHHAYHNLIHVGAKTAPLQRRFDLALCLEVAEHLPEASARTIVATLTALSPVVLFSAAIPGQGGPGHVNEQWPAYWAKHFAKHHYGCRDVLRPQIWADSRVEWWYRQNILIFMAGAEPVVPPALVHPECFLGAVGACPPEIYREKRYGWK
jgi:SAM-dependent methyltransferase